MSGDNPKYEYMDCARPFRSLENLYDAQRDSAEFVISKIQKIACHNYNSIPPEGTKEQRCYTLQDISRKHLNRVKTHNVFLIDGNRGTGKTTLLLTVNHILTQLSLNLSPEDSDGYKISSYDRSTMHTNSERKTAFVLPVIFPDDLHEGAEIIEAIYAHIVNILSELHDKSNNAYQKENLKSLLNKIQNELSVSWSFSSPMSAEVIKADAIDYTHYAQKRSQYMCKGYERINRWYDLLPELLDALNCQMLVPIFDDIDTEPHMAPAIMRDISQYLSHPRIATIFAVNYKTLKEHTVTRYIENPTRMHAVGFSIMAPHEDYTSFLATINEQVLAYFDKIFPKFLRTHLHSGSRRLMDSFSEELSYTNLCVNKFFDHKNEKRKLEWWLINAPYCQLVTTNIRNLVHFTRAMESTKEKDTIPHYLYCNDGFFTLSYLYGNNLEDLIKSIDFYEFVGFLIRRDEVEDDPIRTKPLSSSYLTTKDRVVHLHGVARHEVSLVDYLCDIEISKNKMIAKNSLLTEQWLMEDDYIFSTTKELRKDHEYGIGSIYAKGFSYLPDNCIYFYQYRFLEKQITNLLKYTEQREGFEPFYNFGSADTEDVIDGIDVLKNFLNPSSTREDKISHTLEYSILHKLYNLLSGEKDDSTPYTKGTPGYEFIEKCGQKIRSIKRMRDHYSLMWLCSIKLGILGTDYNSANNNNFSPDEASLKRFLITSDLSSSITRFLDLSQKILCGNSANEHQNNYAKSIRTRVLFAWSLCRTLSYLEQSGYAAPEEKKWTDKTFKKSYEKLYKCIEDVTNEFSHFQQESSSEKVIEYTKNLTDENKYEKNSPEKILQEKAKESKEDILNLFKEWHFPDFSNEFFERVIEDLKKIKKADDFLLFKKSKVDKEDQAAHELLTQILREDKNSNGLSASLLEELKNMI